MWSLVGTVIGLGFAYEGIILTLQEREWDAATLALTPLSACVRFLGRRVVPVSSAIVFVTAYMAIDSVQTHVFEGIFHVWNLYKQVEFLLYRVLCLLTLRVALHLIVHRRHAAPVLQQGVVLMAFAVEASRVVCPLQTPTFVGQALAFTVCSVAEGRAKADEMILTWIVTRYFLTTPAPLF